MSALLLIECCKDSGCEVRIVVVHGHELQFPNFMCNYASSRGLEEWLDIGEFVPCCYELEIAISMFILVVLGLLGECFSKWAKCMHPLVDLAMSPCVHEHHSGIPSCAFLANSM